MQSYVRRLRYTIKLGIRRLRNAMVYRKLNVIDVKLVSLIKVHCIIIQINLDGEFILINHIETDEFCHFYQMCMQGR